MNNFFKNRKIKTRNVLISLIVAAVLLIGFMIYQNLNQDKPVITPGGAVVVEPPEFLFHIYGDENNRISKPLDVDVDGDGKIYVTDYGNHEVKVFNKKGKFLFKFSKVGPEGALNSPVGIAVAKGKVYVADTMKSQLYEFDDDGKFRRSLITADIKRQIIGATPCGVSLAQNGDLYLTDILNHRIIILDSEGRFKMKLGVAGEKEGELAYPNDLAADDKGKVFVSDSNNYRIQVFDEVYKTGKIFTKTPEGQQLFGSLTRGIAVDGKNQVWVVDALSHKVRVFDETGAQLFEFGQFGYGDGEFNFPNGIAVKGDRIYVTDRENNRICVFGY
ncbi:MAG: 6-bladed beta-propeller [Bacillota bacterium]